jgi:hypothetical protein
MLGTICEGLTQETSMRLCQHCRDHVGEGKVRFGPYITLRILGLSWSQDTTTSGNDHGGVAVNTGCALQEEIHSRTAQDKLRHGKMQSNKCKKYMALHFK